MNSAPKKLLILDIDETLVYATRQPLSATYDFRAGGYYVTRRPGLDAFLRFCFGRFRVAVWTSSTRSYADLVVPQIFETPEHLEFVWARERCTRQFFPEEQDFEWVKDLRKLKRKGHDLKDVLMVDNTPKKLNRNYGNLVRVDDFEGEPGDRELTRLRDYLNDLAGAENVRRIEKRGWQSRYPID